MTKSAAIPSYRIIDITVYKFATYESNFIRDERNVSIELRLSHGANPPKNRFMTGMDITLKQKGNPIINIETRMAFDFRAEDYGRFIDGDGFRMPTEMVRYFTSILYGTTRGILMSRLENTSLNGIILQPIDLGEVIDRPLEIHPSKDVVS